MLGVAKGGPTAAAGAWRHLDWWRAKLGLPIPTRAPFIEEFRQAEPGHVVKQAPELLPWVYKNLVAMANRGDGVTVTFVRLMLLVTTGCVRFKHQQRSHLVEMDGTYLVMECALGKSRSGGSRKPFKWLVPRVLEKGGDTGCETLVSF